MFACAYYYKNCFAAFLLQVILIKKAWNAWSLKKYFFYAFSSNFHTRFLLFATSDEDATAKKYWRSTTWLLGTVLPEKKLCIHVICCSTLCFIAIITDKNAYAYLLVFVLCGLIVMISFYDIMQTTCAQMWCDINFDFVVIKNYNAQFW